MRSLKKRSKKMKAVALALFMSGSMVLNVQAVANAACSCGYDYATEVGATGNYTYEYVNPSEHRVYGEFEYLCMKCWNYYYDYEFVGYQGHDYVLDIDSNMLICSGCDAYGYTKQSLSCILELNSHLGRDGCFGVGGTKSEKAIYYTTNTYYWACIFNRLRSKKHRQSERLLCN